MEKESSTINKNGPSTNQNNGPSTIHENGPLTTQQASLTTLQKEWQTLQTQFDAYEKYSLLIKLFNLAVCLWLVFLFEQSEIALVIGAVIWLQDGIWKTFQSRMAHRLEIIEQAIKAELATQSTQAIGMQFNSQWAEQRQGVVSLIGEYIKNSLKPTVAYPHLVILGLIGLYWFCG